MTRSMCRPEEVSEVRRLCARTMVQPCTRHPGGLLAVESNRAHPLWGSSRTRLKPEDWNGKTQEGKKKPQSRWDGLYRVRAHTAEPRTFFASAFGTEWLMISAWVACTAQELTKLPDERKPVAICGRCHGILLVWKDEVGSCAPTTFIS